MGKLDDKYRDQVRELVKLPHNNACMNCDYRGPAFVVMNFRIFVCDVCAGIHRQSQHTVKGISYATFSKEEVQDLERGGNDVASKIWFPKEIPYKPRYGDTDEIKRFINSVYIQKKWYKPAAEASFRTQVVNDVAPFPEPTSDSKIVRDKNLEYVASQQQQQGQPSGSKGSSSSSSTASSSASSLSSTGSAPLLSQPANTSSSFRNPPSKSSQQPPQATNQPRPSQQPAQSLPSGGGAVPKQQQPEKQWSLDDILSSPPLPSIPSQSTAFAPSTQDSSFFAPSSTSSANMSDPFQSQLHTVPQSQFQSQPHTMPQSQFQSQPHTMPQSQTQPQRSFNSSASQSFGFPAPTTAATTTTKPASANPFDQFVAAPSNAPVVNNPATYNPFDDPKYFSTAQPAQWNTTAATSHPPSGSPHVSAPPPTTTESRSLPSAPPVPPLQLELLRTPAQPQPQIQQSQYSNPFSNPFDSNISAKAPLTAPPQQPPPPPPLPLSSTTKAPPNQMAKQPTAPQPFEATFNDKWSGSPNPWPNTTTTTLTSQPPQMPAQPRKPDPFADLMSELSLGGASNAHPKQTPVPPSIAPTHNNFLLPAPLITSQTQESKPLNTTPNASTITTASAQTVPSSSFSGRMVGTNLKTTTTAATTTAATTAMPATTTTATHQSSFSDNHRFDSKFAPVSTAPANVAVRPQVSANFSDNNTAPSSSTQPAAFGTAPVSGGRPAQAPLQSQPPKPAAKQPVAASAAAQVGSGGSGSPQYKVERITEEEANRFSVEQASATATKIDALQGEAMNTKGFALKPSKLRPMAQSAFDPNNPGF